MHTGKFTTAVLALVALATLAPVPSRAQTTGDEWARWWYGAYGGVNVNLFSGEVHDLDAMHTGVAAPNGFTDGSGLGLHIGGLVEYNSNALLGFTLMAGYDNHTVDFTDVTTDSTSESLSTGFSYLSIEPNLRINLGNRNFHLMLGPSMAINLAKGYTYSLTIPATTVTTSADAENVRSVVFGGQAGLGYDIPLAGPDADPQVLLTPFAQFRIGQNLFEPPSGSANDFALNTVRAGIALKFGAAPTPPKPPEEQPGATAFDLRTPPVITTSRRIEETFPMRNYIFFDPGSASIPSRYVTLSQSDANSFREEQLLRSDVETGAGNKDQVRSKRQMQAYYNLLNVVGDRMRRNPEANIGLSGAANGDADMGRQMAANVRDYLVNTFGIDPSRIKVEGVAMPANRSGSGGSTGADKKLIDAENYRVTIEGPQEILKPIAIVTREEEPIDNDIVVTIPRDPTVTAWSVDVRGGDIMRSYGPYRNTTTARIDGKEVLGSHKDGRFQAKVIAQHTDGTQTVSQVRDFYLVRADDEEEATANRYSILFEFDESKTVQTYQKFLTETVAPQIPDGATVIIHGHTDEIGDPQHNMELSQHRAEEAQRVLASALQAAGKKVTFDAYGFGENADRAPFNNSLPEQRYYNRTVVIEVVPQI